VTAVSLPSSFAEFERLVLPAAVLEVDGTIISVNAAGAQMLARPAVEIVGRKAWEFAPGMEHVWRERLAAEHAGMRFTIAIATPNGALALEYVISMCDLDGQACVVAIATEVKGLD
jgi:PAS domain-containing protein